MPVYRVTASNLEELSGTTFAKQGLKERSDLQRLLRANISVVAPDVLVIGEEFGEWEESKRRIDLLAVDRDANLVVIELKRDEEGGHMELQALRYAAMVSAMTFARAVDVYRGYLSRTGSTLDAQASLLEFLEWAEPREDDFAGDVRIVLVSADFSKELTTSVLWLNERDVDIRCVRLRPYRMGSETLIDAQQVIPLPEAVSYTVQLKQKGQAVKQEKAGREKLRLAFWQSLQPMSRTLTPRFADITPGDDHWLSATAGVSGMRFSYLIWQTASGFELYIDREIKEGAFNKAAFDYLYARREQIEGAYGGELTWRRLDDRRACRILEENLDGGIRSPAADWPVIQQRMVERMAKFEAAFTPHLAGAVAAGQAVVGAAK